MSDVKEPFSIAFVQQLVAEQEALPKGDEAGKEAIDQQIREYAARYSKEELLAATATSAEEKAEMAKDRTRSFEALFPLNFPDDMPFDKQIEMQVGATGNQTILHSSPAEIAQESYPTSDRSADEHKKFVYAKDKAVELAKRARYRENAKEIEQLKERLDARGMKAGNVLGLGGAGVVFELTNKDGERVSMQNELGETVGAVLRFDPTDLLGTIDNPGAVPILFQEKGKNFTASIVPTARDIEMPEEQKIAEIRKTLAVFNAHSQESWGNRDESESAGKLAHFTDLDCLKDLKPGQFMKLPDVDNWVMADLSSMSSVPLNEAKAKTAMGGGIDVYIDTYDKKVPGSTARTHVDSKEYEIMKKQVGELKDKVLRLIQEKGIDIESVRSASVPVDNVPPLVKNGPTKTDKLAVPDDLTEATGDPVGQSAKKAAGRE